MEIGLCLRVLSYQHSLCRLSPGHLLIALCVGGDASEPPPQALPLVWMYQYRVWARSVNFPKLVRSSKKNRKFPLWWGSSQIVSAAFAYISVSEPQPPPIQRSSSGAT